MIIITGKTIHYICIYGHHSAHTVMCQPHHASGQEAKAPALIFSNFLASTVMAGDSKMIMEQKEMELPSSSLLAFSPKHSGSLGEQKSQVSDEEVNFQDCEYAFRKYFAVLPTKWDIQGLFCHMAQHVAELHTDFHGFNQHLDTVESVVTSAASAIVQLQETVSIQHQFI